MPTRLILLLTTIAFMVTIVRILSLFHDFEKGPITGFRKRIITRIMHYMCIVILFICGLRYEKKHIEFDYSKYLGPDYKNDKRKSKYTSTIVTNHVSWLDSIILFCCFECSFAPSKEFKSVPGVGVLAQAIDCIFIPRGST
jgi:1-acyl-sn-glycerol-3-phosphate acyltransferase